MTATTRSVTEYAARLSPRTVKLTTAAVLVSQGIAALDGTVVATAMPTIVGDLHGIDHYAWVFSAYLLATIASIPLWGRLADMIGRKPIFLSGMVIFVGASALCGMSGSMWQLILFRGLQGIGGGCLLPVAQTIAADLYTLEQRPKISALFAAEFALCSVVGPILGGFLTDTLSWRWVFFVNLPIGVAAIFLVQRFMVEPVTERRRHRLDVAGAGMLIAWTAVLLFALETAGRDYAWDSALIIGCFVASASLLAAFIVIELKAEEPLIPFTLFRVPALRAGTITSLFFGMSMFAVISYLPLFSQVVTGSSATGAGRALTPLMLAMVTSSVFGARVLLRAGYRLVVIGGAVFFVVGAMLMTQLDASSSQFEVARDMVILGLGMGCTMVATSLAAQNSVDMSRMGVATSLVNFMRQLGGAIGVSVAGAVMLSSLTTRLQDAFPGAHINPGRLLAPGQTSTLPASARDAVKSAFAGALHEAFVVSLVLVVLGALTTLLMPRGSAIAIRDRARGLIPEPADAMTGDSFVIAEPIDEPEPLAWQASVPAPGGNGGGNGAPDRATTPDHAAT